MTPPSPPSAPTKTSSNERSLSVVRDIGLLVTCDESQGSGPLGTIEKAAIVFSGNQVSWIGQSSDLDAYLKDTLSNNNDRKIVEDISADGALVSPGLVDCHSHPIFVGDRSIEFAKRARGESYQEIANSGGGIAASMVPTRNASIELLNETASPRLRRCLEAGTTTTEAKSGYALSVDGEIRMLKSARALDALLDIDISPTLLGAHVVPPDRANEREMYIAEVIEQMIPMAVSERLADAIDVYCDEGAFTVEESRKILSAGKQAGLRVRAHIGQFADLGGAEMVAALGGASCDHLEKVSPTGIAAMAEAGVVGVMLPGACVQLNLTPPPGV